MEELVMVTNLHMVEVMQITNPTTLVDSDNKDTKLNMLEKNISQTVEKANTHHEKRGLISETLVPLQALLFALTPS